MLRSVPGVGRLRLASAETRSLKLYHLHTHEKAEIVFKRNGRYDPDGLSKINLILRDWRRNEPTKMDPRLFDLVWQAYRACRLPTDYIQVVCGYRSPSTNSMLRSRSKGVAEKSQHMLGKAMDFYIPDVPLKKLRDIGLKMQGGGVGYYPTSGSPFVHMDVGNVRHWPRISRQELVAVFPRRQRRCMCRATASPCLASSRRWPPINRVRRAAIWRLRAWATTAPAAAPAACWQRFFGGGGADEDEDDASTAVASAQPPVPAKPVAKQPEMRAVPPALAGPAEQPGKPDIRIVPPELARPAEMPQDQLSQPEPGSLIAALPRNGVPVPNAAPRPPAGIGQAGPETVPFQVASGIDVPAADGPKVNVPLPTRRPNYTPPPELVADADNSGDDDSVSALLAMAGDNGHGAAPMPSGRPDDDDPSFIVAALPSPHAKLQALSNANPVAVAPADAASAAYAPADDDDDPFGIPPSDAIGLKGAGPAAKGARVLTASASPRAALEARLPGTDPAKALASGVRTTAKGARPHSSDSKPGPKSVVLAAQPQAARWAWSSDTELAQATVHSTSPPAYAYNLVRTAPREVYTAGFKAETKVADANRFTGKAVEFLSLARFDQISGGAPCLLPARCVRLPLHLLASAAAARAGASISSHRPALTSGSGATQEPPTQITLASADSPRRWRQ